MIHSATKTILVVGFQILVATLANSQELIQIRFQPGDQVYVYETQGIGTPGELYSAVIQNIALINAGSDSLTIRDVEISAMKDGVDIQKVVVPKSHMAQSAAKFKVYQDQGIFRLYDFQFQTSKYLKGVKFSGGTTLSENEALVITHRSLLFQTLPDSIQVVVRANDNNGKTVTQEESLLVVNHTSKNEYHLPLKGTWVAAAAPSLISHHRWAGIQEFAFDFVQIGANGKTYKGEGSKLSDYYAYGAPIYSIGDGKVVSVKDDAGESDQNLKQPDETNEEYLTRLAIYQQELLSKGFENVLGNHIIIEHEGGEYSYYLHLKKGSLKVQPGDLVSRGEQIAELGHSGNSTEPHLHFHLTDGPDMSYSRSIPVSFHNISLFPDDNEKIRHIHSGQIIITRDQ